MGDKEVVSGATESVTTWKRGVTFPDNVDPRTRNSGTNKQNKPRKHYGCQNEIKQTTTPPPSAKQTYKGYDERITSMPAKQRESRLFVRESLFFNFDTGETTTSVCEFVHFSSSILNGIVESLAYVRATHEDTFNDLSCICPVYFEKGRFRDCQITVTGKSHVGITDDRFVDVVCKEMSEEIGIVPESTDVIHQINGRFRHPTNKIRDRVIRNYVVDVSDCQPFSQTHPSSTTFFDLSQMPDDIVNKIQVLVYGDFSYLSEFITNISYRYPAADTDSIRGFRVIRLTDIERLLTEKWKGFA